MPRPLDSSHGGNHPTSSHNGRSSCGRNSSLSLLSLRRHAPGHPRYSELRTLAGTHDLCHWEPVTSSPFSDPWHGADQGACTEAVSIQAALYRTGHHCESWVLGANRPVNKGPLNEKPDHNDVAIALIGCDLLRPSPVLANSYLACPRLLFSTHTSHTSRTEYPRYRPSRVSTATASTTREAGRQGGREVTVAVRLEMQSVSESRWLCPTGCPWRCMAAASNRGLESGPPGVALRPK